VPKVEVTKGWRELHNGFMTLTLHQMLVGVIKSRRMRLARQMARLGEKMVSYRVSVGI